MFAAVRRAQRPAADTVSVRTREHRRRLDEIASFLLLHDLDVTDAGLTVARAHLAGEPAVVAEISALLRRGDALDDAAMARIAERTGQTIGRDFLATAADQLVARLAECLAIVARSRALGERYEAAIAGEEMNVAADPAGAFRRIIGLTQDVVAATRAMEDELETARDEASALRTSLARAERDATIDHLTGLPNRRAFERRLEKCATGCVALIDIDDFKAVNDRHGHETGDRVLRFVGRLLTRELGRDVLVARYGGEEFACLFADPDATRAAASVDRARQQLGERSLVNRHNDRAIGRLTFSAGIAAIDPAGRPVAGRADEMLYAAKRAGKNGVRQAPPAA